MVACTLAPAVELIADTSESRVFSAGVMVKVFVPTVKVYEELALMFWAAGSVTF